MKKETGKQAFKIDDLAVCNDARTMEEVITEGQIYTVKGLRNESIIEILSDRGKIEGAFLSRFSLYKRRTHQVGTIFSVLNEKDAEVYIGRMVEGCDPAEYRKGEWDKGMFEMLRGEKSDYPFKLGNEIYTLIRLIPESFEEPKPKIAHGLIEALKKSVQQWQIMYDTGKSKQKVYKFLGGEGMMDCFLCVSAGRLIDGGTEHCHKCINWGPSCCYQNSRSPFYVWREDQCKENTLLMLNHLKSELVRLESLSK